jgi:hypothetical protein
MKAADFKDVAKSIEKSWKKGDVRFQVAGKQYTAEEFTADMAQFDKALASKVTKWIDAGNDVSSHIAERMSESSGK